MLLEWRGKGSGRGTERQMTCVPGAFHVFSFNLCNFPVKNLMPIHRREMRLGGLMCMDMSITIIGVDDVLIEGLLVGKVIGSYEINQYCCIFPGIK